MFAYMLVVSFCLFVCIALFAFMLFCVSLFCFLFFVFFTSSSLCTHLPEVFLEAVSQPAGFPGVGVGSVYIPPPPYPALAGFGYVVVVVT
jgi:hypothetical protein